MKKLLVILLAAIGNIFCCRAGIVQQADSAYLADDFLTAASLYETSIDSLGPSADRYYNLGNAYYRVGLLGMAIVSYERALRLDPTNTDIRENLEFVNSKTVDRIEPQAGLIGGTVDGIAGYFHPNSWAWIALATFVLALGGVCVYFFSSGIMLRKIGFFGGGVLLIVCVLANVLAWRSSRRVAAGDSAVVTSPSVILSTTPRTPKDRTEEALLLHEGAKVTILDSIAGADNTWYDVRVDSEHRAWVPADAIEII